MSGHDSPLTPEQIAAVKDESIDFSDIAELDDGFWKQAELVEPDRTDQITMRVKRYVLAYFKASGKGYQTRMNRVLESYVRHKTAERSSPFVDKEGAT
ncbi:MAG: BrnA antitoxin family protein [Gemmatimonadetes bacterium]|nr:BrnA antitoxin family protein [Gemmatimonadota bacterium]MYA41333.1 BrnA antitoxin family protein [Gemmatimonadota bacterium]MYE92634.1 BrnA antitoxin family protein [Gemmatimonadota bacterium]MYJ11791.1 BrnA antitoxin family protein [Gemmatimonadota bacterium]